MIIQSTKDEKTCCLQHVLEQRNPLDVSKIALYTLDREKIS